MSSLHFEDSFTDLPAENIHSEAEKRLAGGWRYVQMLAVNKDESVDLLYSYMLDGALENMVVRDIPHDSSVKSISDLYLEAFVCENEINDLFGITFDGLVLDFLGNFYTLSTEKPMTIISPEQLAEREKMKKIEAAKAAKAAREKTKTEGKAVDKSKSDTEAELEAKLSAMDPEKAAKVRAAMKAKAAKEVKEELITTEKGGE